MGRPMKYPRYEVDPVTGCWNWLLSKMWNGYGSLKGRSAHRKTYEDKFGPIPKGFQLDHLCRNRACVNPDHLEPVTNATNQQRGLKAKLTWEQVREIRKRFNDGEAYRKLAPIYGVAENSIWRIVSNQTWKENSHSNFRPL